MQAPTPLFRIVDENWIQILAQLDAKSVGRFALCSRQTNRISKISVIWYALICKHYLEKNLPIPVYYPDVNFRETAKVIFSSIVTPSYEIRPCTPVLKSDNPEQEPLLKCTIKVPQERMDNDFVPFLVKEFGVKIGIKNGYVIIFKAKDSPQIVETIEKIAPPE